MTPPKSKPDPAAGREAARLDEYSPAFRDCPHAALEALRGTDPVYRDQAMDRVVALNADDVDAILADRTWSSDPFKGRPSAFGRRFIPDSERSALSMLFLDDPDHARLRTLVTKAFTFKAVEALRPRIAAIADDLLSRIDPGRPFDLIAAFASPLPVLVIAAMLGVENSDVERFRRWSEDLALAFSKSDAGSQQRVEAAREGLNAYFRRTMELRRSIPRDDLISTLVAAEAEGQRLTETELLNTCRILLAAGNVTTTDLIGNGVTLLLRHADERARLRADPDLWPAAVEEMLRFDPPVLRVNRQATEARHLGGCPVDAGQTATAMLVAANRDPALHDDPNRFSVDRPHQKHFSFGGGAHFCLGASLARLEAHIAFSKLFERFPTLRLAPDHGLQRRSLPAFNGFESVWLIAA